MNNDTRALRHELDTLEDAFAGIDLISALTLVGENFHTDPLGVAQDALRLGMEAMIADPLTPPPARCILQLIDWSGEPLAPVARVLELIALLDDEQGEDRPLALYASLDD